MYFWQDVGEKELLNEYIGEMIQNDKGLLKFLSIFKHKIRSFSGTHYSEYYEISKNNIVQFLDIKNLEERLKQMDKTSLSIQEQELIELALTGLQESDDNLDCLFDEDNIDETEKDFMNDAENCEKEDVKNDKDEIHECMSKLLDWMYLPFSYNRSDPEETDNFAMDRITDLMRLNKEYDRHKIIQILQTVKKSNIIEENNEMLDILIHQFSIATDKEYETLQRLIFKEDAE